MYEAKILIVDDEDVVLRSCVRIFRNHRYYIETVYSAETALSTLKSNIFDLLITDLKMPGMGGMELLKIARARYKEMMAIIFTGYANVETAREALKLGAFDYVPKPFTPEELRDVVVNALQTKKNNSQGAMLDLMAIVSHELKSPVSVVHTTAETLYRGYFGNLEPKQQEIIATILRNCGYLEDIIRTYIDLSKMELDELESFSAPVDLAGDVIEPVLAIPEMAANLKNMKIESLIESRPTIEGDRNLLEIVVRNLVGNAIKYGRDNTSVQIKLTCTDNKALFSVYNEGVGIPDESKDRLFSKFGRLKQNGTQGIKGSGLGLYICKKIVDKHHGQIWAESEPGNNVTFFVEFNCL